MARTHKVTRDDVLERFLEAKAAREGIEEVWLRAYLAYRGHDPALQRRRQENRAGIFVPKLYTRVETAVPRLVNALLSERPYALAIPRNLELDPVTLGESVRRASVMTALVDYQLAEVLHFDAVMAKVVRAMLIYGVAPAQVGWRELRRRVRRRSAVSAPGSPAGRERVEETVLGAPAVEPFDPFGFYWDPFAQTLEEAEFVIVQSFRRARWLEERKGAFRNVPRALETRLPEGLPTHLTERRVVMGWHDQDFEDLYEVLELWTPERVVTLVNRDVVVRDEELPFEHGELPFAVAVDGAMLGEFAGLGMVISALDLQDELNAKRNQRLDNVNLILNPPLKVLNTSMLTEDDVQVRPGKLVPVTQMDEIQPMLELANVTQHAYQEEEYINRDIDESTGVYPYMMGAPPQRSRERATTVVALQSAGEERLRLRVRLLETQFLLRVVKQIAALDRQFLPAQGAAALVPGETLGREPVLVSREDIDDDFEFMWVGSSLDSVAERQFKVNQMIQLLGVLNQVEGFNRREYVRRILQLMGIRGINQIVPPAVPAPVPLVPAASLPAAPPGVPVVGPSGGLPNQLLESGLPSLRIGPTPLETPAP